MIQRECKCLAVVDFVAVSKHAACEKLIRHGHPSMLHLWWAHRPLMLSWWQSSRVRGEFVV